MKNSGIEWIGQIPDSWQLVNIGNVLKEYKNENKLLDTHALQFKYGTIVPKKETNATQDVLDILSKYNVVKPNIIMVNGLNLAFDFVTQRVALVKENGVITSTYIALSPQNLVVPQYATYVLKSYDFQKVFHSLGRGLRCMLSYDILRREKMPLPSLDKQKSIVNCLEQKLTEVDKLIEVQQAQIEKLKEYKQSVITEAVTKGLDPTAPMKDSGVEWIGKIPEGWNVNRIKYCSSYNDESIGETENVSRTIKYVDIGSVSLSDGITKIEEFTFGDAPSRARRITHKGDIIVSTVRTYLKAIAIIDKDDLIVSTGFCVLRPNGKISSKYMEYYCKSDRFTNNVSQNSYGISYPAINSSTLVSFYILEPSVDEQNRIADYLDDKCAKIDKLIALKQSKIEKLQEYKKSLIYEYVTGKKEVI